MAGAYFVRDEVYPVAAGPFFYQEEKIIVFPVREKKLGVALETGAVDLPDLEKTVPVYFPAGLLQGIARNVIFLPERMHVGKVDWHSEAKVNGIFGWGSGEWVKCPERTYKRKSGDTES